MNSCHVFQCLAAATWRRIRDGHRYGIRQGEEGISDWLLLDIVGSRIADVRVAKTSKALEANQGTDWEWWIGDDNHGWLRYAVQAKMIDVPSSRFITLNHKINNTFQYDVLQRYATQQRAIPIYCLYTFLPSYVPSCLAAHSVHPPDLYGCSVVPEATIRAAASRRGAKRFAALDQTGSLFPWCCLVCNSAFAPTTQALNPLRPPGNGASFVHERLPFWLEMALEAPGEPIAQSRDRLPAGAPSRYLVVKRPEV